MRDGRDETQQVPEGYAGLGPLRHRIGDPVDKVSAQGSAKAGRQSPTPSLKGAMGLDHHRRGQEAELIVRSEAAGLASFDPDYGVRISSSRRKRRTGAPRECVLLTDPVIICDSGDSNSLRIR